MRLVQLLMAIVVVLLLVACAESQATPTAMPLPEITGNRENRQGVERYLRTVVRQAAPLPDWYPYVTSVSVTKARLTIQTNLAMDEEGEQLAQSICALAADLSRIKDTDEPPLERYIVRAHDDQMFCDGTP